MAITYYPTVISDPAGSTGYPAPSGVYSNSGNDVTITSNSHWINPLFNVGLAIGSCAPFSLWDDAFLWIQGGRTVVNTLQGGGEGGTLHSTVLFQGSPLHGVDGIGLESEAGDGVYQGIYSKIPQGPRTLTPILEGYVFDPVSVTLDTVNGPGCTVDFTASLTPLSPPKAVNPSPIDSATKIKLLPILTWEAG